MALPTDLHKATVTRRGFLLADGSPETGYVQFTLSERITLPADFIDLIPNVPLKSPLVNGALSYALFCNDDPVLGLVDSVWHVVEQFDSGGGLAYDIKVPLTAAGQTVDIRTLVTTVTGGGGTGGGTTGGSTSGGTTGFTESADGTSITTTLGIAAAGSITDAAGHVYRINASNVITIDGVADPSTNNVVQLYYKTHAVYQKNTQPAWYTEPYPNGPGQLVSDPTVVSGGGTTTGGATAAGVRPLAAASTTNWTKKSADFTSSTTVQANAPMDFFLNRDGSAEDGDNNPSSELTNSVAVNCRVAGGVAQLWTTKQVDPTNWPVGTYPYSGSHLQGKSRPVQAGCWVAYHARVTNRGSNWPALVLYGSSEIDIAEWGNTTQGATPTQNAHPDDYSSQPGEQAFNGNPALAGDGKFHWYETYIDPDGQHFQVFLDGLAVTNKMITDSDGTKTWSISIENGVNNGLPASSTEGVVVECDNITVFYPA